MFLLPPRKTGLYWTSFIITFFAVLCSVVIYLFLSFFFGKSGLPGIAKALIIPAIIAPFLSYFFLRILVKLDLAEKSLRESETLYRNMVERADDGIILVQDRIIRFANNRIAEITGYPVEELQGKDFSRYIHPDQVDKINEKYAKRMAGEPLLSNYETTLKHKNGQDIFVSINAGLSVYDGKPANLVFIRDLSEKKKTQLALAESEEKYRQLFEMESDALFLIENDTGRILEVNPYACALYGYGREELLHMDHTQVSAQPEDTRKATHGHLARVPLRYHTKKNGEIFPVEITAKHFTWQGRQVHIAAIRDITLRIEAEKKQRQTEARLRQAQKMEAIGTLAGGVAHDLNNILSGLVSYPELLLLDLPADSPLRQPVLTIKKSGEKAAAMVNDLLTFARRGVPVSEVVHLNDIIKEYLESPEYKTLAASHPEVSVQTRLEANLHSVLGSPFHLSKITMNLLSNAMEAVPGEGEVTIITENRFLEKPLSGYEDIPPGEYVLLRVSDSGVGLLPEEREKIFEPFYTRKAMGRSGTGLGMAVVWGVVKDHKGSIDIESLENQGATFSLYFPAAEETKMAKPVEARSFEDYKGRGQSILIVDDVEEQREIALNLLKKLDYSVAAVSSGQEAVDYLRDNRADLVLLDMIMEPGMDGLDAYKKMLEIHPGQKVVIASGFSETDRVKEAQKMGAGPYIRKPYSMEEIGMAVKGELEGPRG